MTLKKLFIPSQRKKNPPFGQDLHGCQDVNKDKWGSALMYEKLNVPRKNIVTWEMPILIITLWIERHKQDPTPYRRYVSLYFLHFLLERGLDYRVKTLREESSSLFRCPNHKSQITFVAPVYAFSRVSVSRDSVANFYSSVSIVLLFCPFTREKKPAFVSYSTNAPNKYSNLMSSVCVI